jgi:hypothetical protein
MVLIAQASSITNDAFDYYSKTERHHLLVPAFGSVLK